MEPFVEGCIEHQRFHESSSEASDSGPEFAETLQDFMSCRISSINGMGVEPKMVGFPNKPMGFPTKTDHFGVEIGGTTI